MSIKAKDNEQRTIYSAPRRLRSLRWKLAFLFGTAFLVGTGLLLGESAYFSEKLQATTRQQTHSGLASDLLSLLTPIFLEGRAQSEVQKVIDHISSANPDIAVYMLDPFGNVIQSFSPHTDIRCGSVPLDAVKEFIAAPLNAYPIYGRSPRDCSQQIFSSAAFLEGGQQRYLYVVLQGSGVYDRARGVARENVYIAQGLTLGVFTFFCALGIGVYFLWLFARRFERIVAVVRSYRDGALEKRLDDLREDELGQLSGMINEMADTIEANIKGLELRDELRRELIANISHDLRGPATHIRIASEKLAGQGDKSSNDISRTLISSVLELERMLQELLELAKLEAKEAQPKLQQFAIEELYDDLSLRYLPEAQAKGLQFVVDVHSGLPFVSADPSLLRRAIGNLLLNAIRYTPTGGTVTLVARRGKHGVLVGVSDTGVGIYQEELQRLFERYYTGSENRPDRPGSTGLGLAITKRIVELHESSIIVESEVNRGTSIYFELPTA